ncbi:MAG: hypothetical protein RL338_429 [Chloroflexota bacterium]|jgi:glutamate formiminotransferase/formiminotetrahydrofolate cyclodeaminase
MQQARSARFRDMTLDGFVELLGSAAPAPGGGSASAIAASLGASLVAMVGRLSEGREKYAAHSATHAWAIGAATELADRFLRLADEDAAAYDALAAAMKLPRETDDEKAARTIALRHAALVASEVPLRTVEACAELAIAADALAGRSNRNASSDLGVASLLAEAAVHGAAENVYVNLPSLGDEPRAAALRERASRCVEEVVAIGARVRAVVASGEERAPLPAGAPR